MPIRRSVGTNFICLEDGKKFRSLKRHLRTAYGLTPQEYREKWDLPADHPMVAPSYAGVRSQLAKKLGMGSSAVSAEARNVTPISRGPSGVIPAMALLICDGARSCFPFYPKRPL